MTMPDYWRRLEAEGRLRVGGQDFPWPQYWTLRLTEEEREKLKHLPAPRALVPQLTNSQLWGEE